MPCFLGVSLVIGLALMMAPFLVAGAQPRIPRRCRPTSARFQRLRRRAHEVRRALLSLVSILFIIFDLEVAFLFPWAVAFKEVGLFGFWSMMVFLGVLTDRLHL